MGRVDIWANTTIVQACVSLFAQLELGQAVPSPLQQSNSAPPQSPSTAWADMKNVWRGGGEVGQHSTLTIILTIDNEWMHAKTLLIVLAIEIRER